MNKATYTFRTKTHADSFIKRNQKWEDVCLSAPTFDYKQHCWKVHVVFTMGNVGLV